MTNQYAMHARLLAGEDIPLSEAAPLPGWYRMKSDGGRVPVFIYKVQDEFRACVGPYQEGNVRDGFADVVRAWRMCCRDPISAEVYARVARDGEPWPDEPPPMGHNLPTDPVERFKLVLDQEAEAIQVFMAAAIEDEDAATKCGLWSKKMGGIADDIDAERKARKKPLDEQIAEIQSTFNPLVIRATDLQRGLKKHMEAYLQAKRQREQEAERLRREAERAALAKAAEEVGTVAPEVPQASRRSRVVTGGVTLRTVKYVVLDDPVAAAAALLVKGHENGEMLDLIRKLTLRRHSAGVPTPGARIETRQEAA